MLSFAKNSQMFFSNCAGFFFYDELYRDSTYKWIQCLGLPSEINETNFHYFLFKTFSQDQN